MNKQIYFFILYIFSASCFALSENSIGQMIKIDTHFHSFVGKPRWLLMVRDVDHGQNIPYVFEVKRGENYWLAPTGGRNYLILASTMQFNTYQAKSNTYQQYAIHDFCHLESRGRINKGQSISLTIYGDLSDNTNTFDCQILKY